MDRRTGFALVIGLAAALAGCTAPPPPPPPTVVSVAVEAANDANPTPAGVGAPVRVRIYQLGSTAGFNGAEFFQLYSQDKATLAADLLARDDFLLAPGQSKTDALMPTDQVKAIGVFAEVRDYSSAVWRGSAPVVPHMTNTITVTAGKAGVTVTAQTAPGKAGP